MLEILKGDECMLRYTALATLLSVAFYFYTALEVAKARRTYGIKAPATTGNEAFERVFRVQMNTLEWMPIFLPVLWLSGVYLSDPISGLLGLGWVAGRVLYMRGYSEAANKRGLGFSIQAICAGLLFLCGLAGILRTFV